MPNSESARWDEEVLRYMFDKEQQKKDGTQNNVHLHDGHNIIISVHLKYRIKICCICNNISEGIAKLGRPYVFKPRMETNMISIMM